MFRRIVNDRDSNRSVLLLYTIERESAIALHVFRDFIVITNCELHSSSDKLNTSDLVDIGDDQHGRNGSGSFDVQASLLVNAATR